MPARILVVVDDSSHCGIAVRLAGEIAQVAGSGVTILSVARRRADLARAQEFAMEAAGRLEPTGLYLRTRVRVGRMEEEVSLEARSGYYNLLIIGESQVRSRIARLRGSTGDRIMARVSCPVIVAKKKCGPIHRVLLCDGGMATPSLPKRFMIRLARLLPRQLDVTVLHVMSQMSAGPGVQGRHLRAGAAELIEAQAPEGELLEQDVQVLEWWHNRTEAKIRHGLVVDEILAEAQSGDYDLLIIGAHRGGGWRRFLLDDLTQQIIEAADRPVLVV